MVRLSQGGDSIDYEVRAYILSTSLFNNPKRIVTVLFCHIKASSTS